MRLRLTCVSALLLLVFCLVVATPDSTKYSGPTTAVDADFFGLHIHRAAAGTEWPDVPFAQWRLWDAGVTWPQLEPQRGNWNFTLLDRYVEIAAQRHVEILLTLGLTPAWASVRPDEPSGYGNGNAAPPRQSSDWEEYVRVVATRYKGRIHQYEIWNEPNARASFTGNAREMLELSREAYAVLKSVDPTIMVVSPSPAGENGVGWLSDFLKAGGCRYADVVGYHFYVTPKPPEVMIPLIDKVKATLHRRGCDAKPLWNTESGWAEPKHFRSEEEAAGFLMRTYLVNWLMGVQRFYWYAWDNHNWSTLDLTSPSTNRMTKAGAAYGVIHGWLEGGVLRACNRIRSGLWTCELVRNDEISRIVWTDEDPQSFTPPQSWGAHTLQMWSGNTLPLHSPVIVGPAPVLIPSVERTVVMQVL